ncbi:MAG: hypothetical protein JKX94_03970 [Sneathiella sp.]|nr:hypothetical protein [Sneathiella sp.]
MSSTIHQDVLPQLADISIEPDRPLIITDADEVLFNFMEGLEIFLEQEGMYFDWSSFALTGNIRNQSDRQPVEAKLIPKLIDLFFAEHCHKLPAAPGAAEHLKKLSQDVQIIVLSNVPPKYAHRRREALKNNNMDFPLIANIGSKGQVVRHLTEHLNSPAFFIDDIPTNHSSVSKHANQVHRLHFIADKRLAKMLGPAEHSHARLDTWPDLHDYIQAVLKKGS